MTGRGQFKHATLERRFLVIDLHEDGVRISPKHQHQLTPTEEDRALGAGLFPSVGALGVSRCRSQRDANCRLK